MSSTYLKTKYNEEGAHGRTEEKILYVHHNNSVDIVTFYDENGQYLIHVEDTLDNNLLDAINRLFLGKLEEGVELLTEEDKNKCGLK